MKNLLIGSAVFIMIISCHNKNSDNASGNDSAAEKNLQAMHNISKAFETGDTSLLANSVAEDFIDHRDYGDVKSIDSLKAIVLSWHEHIKNLKIETVKELADGDYVMSWMQFRGTGDGQGGTTSGDFNVSGVEIIRFKNGKAVEHWEAMDIRDVYKMTQKLTAGQNSTVPDSVNAQ
jgi:predicted SnoaL-like aldol condensation-catalyzing enzyme